MIHTPHCRTARRNRLPLAATLLAMALTACASTSMRARPGASFQLAPGQQVVLPDDATLTYVHVAQDSRCPPNVQCIRAGDADVVFEHRPAGGESRRLTLNLPEAPTARIDGFTLRILALEFGERPKATLRIDATTP